MNERTRIIVMLSDAELLMFHAIGGVVPVQVRGRLAQLIDAAAARSFVPEHKHEPPAIADVAPRRERRISRLKGVPRFRRAA